MTIPDVLLDIGWTKICLYIYIKKKCGKEGSCSISTREVADEFSLTRPTASRYISELESLGVLWRNGHQTDTKRTLISLKNRALDAVDGHQTDTKRTLTDRKKEFVEKLKPYLDKYGKDMLNDFYRYWSQVNEGGTKMLWEKQKAFEIRNRLVTWKQRSLKNEQKTTDIGVVLHHEKDKFKNEKEW